MALILAIMVHYHFIKTRLQAQTEEAIKVSILHGSDTGHNSPLPLHQDQAAGTDRGGTQCQGWAFAHSHNRSSHIFSFQKSNCAIARTIALLKIHLSHIFALFKRAIVQSPTRSLLRKERQKERLHNGSFKRVIVLFSLEKSDCAKMCEKSAIFQIALYCSLSNIFKMSDCPTLLKVSILHGSDTGNDGPLPLQQDKAAGTDREGTQGQYPPWF